MKENEDLKLAKEELEKLKQDEHDRYMAELRMKYIRDMNGIKEFGIMKVWKKVLKMDSKMEEKREYRTTT